MSSNPECTLCGHQKTEFFAQIVTQMIRDFYRCPECKLIFCHPEETLSSEQERERYGQHQNHIRTPGYENFLGKLFRPVLDLVESTAKGLDYGRGPYPMMEELVKERGFEIAGYDPFFAADEKLLEARYDFITCSEVAEHFCYPAKDFQQMFRMLNPRGVLGVMTSLYSEEIDFLKWHYVKDDTHISIYSKETMQWIAKKFGFKVELIGQSVTVFQAP